MPSAQRLDDLNAWLAACRAAEDGKVVSANSLWTRHGAVQLRPEFRQTIRKQKYGAELHAGRDQRGGSERLGP